MIQSARFTNINGKFIDFNTNDIPFESFTTEVDWRFTEKPKSQEHGIYKQESYLGKRLFHAQGQLFATDSANYNTKRLAMMGALMPHPQFGMKVVGTLEIAFDGVDELLSCECTLDGYPELPLGGASPSRSPYQINFKAFDPRMYGGENSWGQFYDPNSQNIGGRSYNKTYNKTYSTTGSSQGEMIITNSGNFDTHPTLTFGGPVTNPTATLATSSGGLYVFKLNGLTLADSNDIAVVDFKNHTVTRGNGQNLYNFAVGSDWWVLEPDPVVNIVRFVGEPIAVPAFMLIEWRNAYMY